MSGEVSYTINRYAFNGKVPEAIRRSHTFFESGLWPLVYILRDQVHNQAYIGETTDVVERMKAHLKNEQKQQLSEAFLISSKKFNKSATLDIESSLIRYMSADKTNSLINGNVGIANHHYFQQKELYEGIFEQVWEELRKMKIVRKTLRQLNNSDLFKYSPYKALSPDQILSLKEMLIALATEGKKHIMVSGGAGTGKSVLAIFLFKLLKTDLDTFKFVELGVEEKEIIALVERVKIRFPALKMGLVVPMASFRKTVSKIFAQVRGLNKSMVLGPSDVAKQQYDILLVDESHRLKRRVNLGTGFKTFDDNSKRLGLDPRTASELIWVTMQAAKVILFYDAGQRIKPSDVEKEAFDQISASEKTVRLKLKTQLRSKGGEALEYFLDGLLQKDLEASQKLKKFEARGYELILFDRLKDLIGELENREKALDLCRLVAGYAWPWVTKPRKGKQQKEQKQAASFDIDLDGVQLKWNAAALDWINSINGSDVAGEVGCIHTVQGYDLNYVGVIFGPEITFNTETGLIEMIKERYHDRSGKNGIRDPKELHRYIQHIYSTLVLRGIYGAFIFVADPALKAYFARYIEQYNPNDKSRYRREVPLIRLDVQKELLVETSRSTLDVFEKDIAAVADRWIACQLHSGSSSADQGVALLRIIYEEPPGAPGAVQAMAAVHPASRGGGLSAVADTRRQVTEPDAVYGKQQWLGRELKSNRFVPIRLKGKDGSFYTVVARFERLLGNFSDPENVEE